MVLSRYDCDTNCLIEAVRKFRGKRILVIGDVMLDRFIWGAVSRISPEAPVPVVEIKTETVCLGGAANVAANIHSLGGCPMPFGVIGGDIEGMRLQSEFRAMDAPVRGLVVDKERATSVKTRIIAHHQQVCRTDRENRTPISAAVQKKLSAGFASALKGAHAVIVSDYAKGLITPSLLKEILPPARSAGKAICIDPKMRNLAVYRPATVITPNTLEAEHAAGMTISSNRDLMRAGRKILGQTRAEYLLITRGEAGMTLFEGNSRVTHIPTVAREVFDVTGAGDTVISTVALGLASGLSILEAAVLSNVAAGIVVGKLGTASATPDELISRIETMQ
jgi:D-beta-D-heptose 7-phosphate kinase/D-beta-D-heptose 1-phosphate adenosyltransferase